MGALSPEPHPISESLEIQYGGYVGFYSSSQNRELQGEEAQVLGLHP